MITRRNGEAVHIGDVTVIVRIVKGDVRLTIEAPRETRIRRDELPTH